MHGDLTPEELIAIFDKRILLCYEKSSDFCHRHILREWLIGKSILINEL